MRVDCGTAIFDLDVAGGRLRSLGGVRVCGAPLRNPAARFLPWFDTYEGDVFREFRFVEVQKRGEARVIRTVAVSDPDALFRERRDCSGDPCLRAAGWDAAPLEVEFRIVLEPAEETIDGRRLTGFRYHFEYESAGVPIHRIADRQTWEVGGNLDDVNLVCRNWLTPPRMRIGRETAYSTVGLDRWAGALPGNLWGRWTLLPAFDMQYGKAGVLLGWFDRVSLIRTVIESGAGEDCIRFVDLHLFEQAARAQTNPKTVLWCADRLDGTDALNLWTRVADREQEKACRQFGIRAEPPAPIVFSENVWQDFHFDRTYEPVVDACAEFGGDAVFIDSVWENGETLRKELAALTPQGAPEGSTLRKLLPQNMCCTFDFEVAAANGGEAGLKALCERAGRKGVRVVSWMAAHVSPRTRLQHDKAMAAGPAGIFAVKESGRHPDTGYAADCWTLDLNAPVYERMRERILGVCQRTGLAGFLWDSYCNLGWWQVDYAGGTMRPQFERMAALFAELVNAGLYVQPEAIVSFSNASCCGLHGGNVYAGDLLGYSYNTAISLHYADGANGGGRDQANEVLKGRRPLDELFQCLAHRRVPNVGFHRVPREEWDDAAVREIKALFAAYRKVRDRMRRRTVLQDGAGVLWEDGAGGRVLFSFKAQPAGVAGDAPWVEAVSGRAAGVGLEANGVYAAEGLSLETASRAL